MPSAPSEHSDPRVARSRRRAIDATVELIREFGSAGVTCEAVAHRSGLARTTLYRQFADREALLFAAFESIPPPPSVSSGGDLVDDIETWLHEFAVALRTQPFAATIPSMIEVAERSERGHELAVDFSAQRRNQLVERLAEAVAEGELAADVDAETTISLLVGPLFYRRFISRQAISRRFVTQVVQATLVPLLVRDQVE